ncbi:MAG: FMN-binding glutamate synthase family protein [Deltaproteobacteria bacterium HGW-Deltaproteobacteria-14]|jgi:glutamate synthase (ferredoxin)|nr:MAG: FMN-binding glutamate synthase family protein [Deltaproteobacteria bacterium HGW-Deltaproteobacteria-14]
MSTAAWILVVIGGLLLLVTIYDLVQTKHAILRNFPIIGHFRYLFEAVGPELRQYIVTNNDEERPFSRDQRRWVYASSKGQNNYFGFGTDNDLESASNYLIIKHSAFPRPDLPHDPGYRLPCAKVLGGPRGRRHAFRPESVINTSAMSFGSLSSAAVEAINRGCAQAGAMQNTGEGGISPYHDNGGDLIYQLGTGYFGSRNKDGSFDLAALQDKVARYRVKAIEVKLSQGAKPGKGGILPGAKVTPEIAAIRGVPVGQDVISPAGHSAFRSVDELLDFVERIADATGLPVGVKSAVGQDALWSELAELMATTGRGVDFVQIDGGEGGTGAAPLVFADHVSLPFKIGFARVRAIFERAGVADRVVWIGSGRIGFPADALFAFGLGCDMVAAAREVMLSVGCIQAQRCHTGHCPTGVATHNRWLVRGLDPTSKAARVAGYLMTFRHELLALTHACGYHHPCEVSLDDFEIVDGCYGTRSPWGIFGFEPGWGRPPAAVREEAAALMRGVG